MTNRNRSGIDFDPSDGEDEGEFELELDYSVLQQSQQSQQQPNVRHDAAPQLDPQQMRSRVTLSDVGEADKSTVAGPLFILMLVLMVLAMVGIAYWAWTPSEEQQEMNKFIKQQNNAW